MPRAIATTDHETIRRWVEARRGHPTVVKSTQSDRRGQSGLLRIDFDKPEDSLEEVSWDDFFETFDQNNLAFLYQETTAAGRKSRFNKFVSREAVDTSDSEPDEDEDARSDSTRASSERTRGGRQASSREEEEAAEEADEDDAMEEDEDFEDDDESYDEDDEDEDEDYEEDEEDEDDDERR